MMMELIDSAGEAKGEDKVIKDRTLRTNNKLDNKRNEISVIKSKIELKEIILSYGHPLEYSNNEPELSNLENLLGHLNDKVTGMQTSIKGLREERDSWIDNCKKHGIVSDQDLEELARGKGEISSGREDLLNKIAGLENQLEELLGHSLDLQTSNAIPYSKKMELQIARLQCEIDMELKFEIKELKLDIKGFEGDCEHAANHTTLKGSCKNRLENENRRSQTVNLQLEDEVKRKELLIQLLRCVKGLPLQEFHGCFEESQMPYSVKMETSGQNNQECTAANELVWNSNCGSLIDEAMKSPGMKEANDWVEELICGRDSLCFTEEELLGDSSTLPEASNQARYKEVYSDLMRVIDNKSSTLDVTISHVERRNDEAYVADEEKVEEQTDGGDSSSLIAPGSRLLTVEKGKSVTLEGYDDSLFSSSSVTLPMVPPRGRGRGRSSRGRSNGSRGRRLIRNASLASIDPGKRPSIVSGDPNPRPQQRLRPLGVTPIPSPTLWNSLDVTKSRAVTLFSESDNADARTFLNTCTPEDALQLNCFKLLNLCQVAIQEVCRHRAELARAKGEAERALTGERVALSKVEHLKLQVRCNRRANVESWVGSQSFADTLAPLVTYHFAKGFSKCRALIADDDPDYDISWLRATPSERFKWDGWTLMQEPPKPPPVYFDDEGGVPYPPPHTLYARLEGGLLKMEGGLLRSECSRWFFLFLVLHYELFRKKFAHIYIEIFRAMSYEMLTMWLILCAACFSSAL